MPKTEEQRGSRETIEFSHAKVISEENEIVKLSFPVTNHRIDGIVKELEEIEFRSSQIQEVVDLIKEIEKLNMIQFYINHVDDCHCN